MAILMAIRIIEGKNSYTEVVEKRADLKEGIDAYLISVGKQELIIE